MAYEEEWEFLPDSRFLDFPENPGEKKIFSGKQISSYPKSVFDMNYFMCPSPPEESKKIIETSSGNSSRKRVTKQLVPVPIQLEPAGIPKKGHQDPEADDDEVIKLPTATTEKIIKGSVEADQDAVLSQVFFKKMKENEFVDMKILDSSPKSPRNIIPQIDASAAGTFNDQAAIDNMTCSPRKKKIEDQVSWTHEEEEEEEDGFGLNLWKWSLTGIGAICSFGVAAATICVIIFGNQQKTKHHQQNLKLPFQIYSDDKRIKQVVQQATKLNEAMSAVRGVPITSAHITYGGYYDAL